MFVRAAQAIAWTIRQGSWSAFVATYLLVFAGGLAATYAFLIAVDPYDSGHFPSLGLVGSAEHDQRLGHVSRSRNTSFDSAIMGSSNGQLLHPVRLSQATGFKFQQLTVAGSGAPEQLALLRWYIRHRPHTGSLVIATDQHWCIDDDNYPSNAFPYWLYSNNRLLYLANVLSSRSIERGLRRVAIALKILPPADPVGYVDYEQGREWRFAPPIHDPRIPPVVPAPDRNIRFPSIERLKALTAGLDRTRVVLVMPPIFFHNVPLPETPEAVVLDRCKAALREVVAGRRNWALLDFIVDDAIARDPRNFMDPTHYRAPVARMLEAAIAAALNGQPEPAQAGALGH